MRRGKLLNLLVDAGLYLLDPLRDRLGDRIESVSERAKDVYETASGRVQKRLML